MFEDITVSSASVLGDTGLSKTQCQVEVVGAGKNTHVIGDDVGGLCLC